jgi:arylsulfatase A-like enzyme
MGDDYLQHVVDYVSVGYAQDPRPAFAQELRDAYYEGARIADADVARLFQAMKARGALDNTLFVITSDHGEAFGEHGILGHGRTLHDELVRIPLVCWGPGAFRGGRVVDEGVGLIDVLPTFFDLAGLRGPKDVDGRSFLPVAAGRAPGRPVIAQELRHMGNARVEGEILVSCVRSPEWKYTLAYDRTSGVFRESVHDLLLDPGETTDLIESDPATIAFPPAFCAAVERCRDLVWEMEVPGRPKPCDFAR